MKSHTIALLLAAFPAFAAAPSRLSPEAMSNTGKAVAGMALGAFAAASASTTPHEYALVYDNPKTTVVVKIYNRGVATPIYLFPGNGGYFGPRGEFYPRIPRVETLTRTYGSHRPEPPMVWHMPPDPTAPRTLEAAIDQGRVIIGLGGKAIAAVQPALPHIEKWKFVEGQRYIVVKSRPSYGRAIVEKFNPRTGVFIEKIPAADIKKKNARWAAGFED